MKVLLNSVPKIREFVEIVNHSSCDVDLVASHSTYLDAKSLLGILSCNINEPMHIEIHDDGMERDDLVQQIEKFVIVG